jgi:hypothetical protein
MHAQTPIFARIGGIICYLSHTPSPPTSALVCRTKMTEKSFKIKRKDYHLEQSGLCSVVGSKEKRPSPVNASDLEETMEMFRRTGGDASARQCQRPGCCPINYQKNHPKKQLNSHTTQSVALSRITLTRRVFIRHLIPPDGSQKPARLSRATEQGRDPLTLRTGE